MNTKDVVQGMLGLAHSGIESAAEKEMENLDHSAVELLKCALIKYKSVTYHPICHPICHLVRS